MFYTLPVTKKGTITVPKQAREDLNITTKVMLVKTESGYMLKDIKSINKIAGSLKTNKKFTDKEIQDSIDKGFLL
jgi:AbrB family looped-hinge helix DNA binding protein